MRSRHPAAFNSDRDIARAGDASGLPMRQARVSCEADDVQKEDGVAIICSPCRGAQEANTMTARTTEKSVTHNGAWKNAVPAAEQQRQSKREVLLREAAAAFNRQGFHGTSLNDIAQKLGVTKAALYGYVESKEDLLYFCHDWAMDGAQASVEYALTKGGDGLQKLRNTLQKYLERMLMEEGGFVILLEENALKPAHAEAIVKRRDAFEVALRGFVSEGVRDGSIVPCNEKLAVFMALGAMNWVRKWYKAEGEWSGPQIAAALSMLLERAVSAKPVASVADALPPSDASRRKRTRKAPAGD